MEGGSGLIIESDAVGHEALAARDRADWGERQRPRADAVGRVRLESMRLIDAEEGGEAHYELLADA